MDLHRFHCTTLAFTHFHGSVEHDFKRQTDLLNQKHYINSIGFVLEKALIITLNLETAAVFIAKFLIYSR